MNILQAIAGVLLACGAVAAMSAAHGKSVVTEEDFTQAVREAVQSKNYTQVRKLLQGHRDLMNRSCRDEWQNQSALEIAAFNDDFELANLLLEAGAGKEAGIDQALYKAVEEGHTRMAELLIRHGADPNVTYRHDPRRTALHAAVFTGDVETFKALLAGGAKIPPGGGLLLHAARSAAMAEYLIARGVPVNAADDDDQTAMFHADAEVAKVLIAHGAKVNIRSKTIGFTPMHHAAGFAGPELVEVLLAAGADVNARDAVGRTPLELAAEDSTVQVVQALIKGGANVNGAGNGGRTPLHVAAGRFGARREGIIQALLDAGADPAARARDGATPMDVAERVKQFVAEASEENKAILQKALEQKRGGKP